LIQRYPEIYKKAKTVLWYDWRSLIFEKKIILK